MKGECSWYPDSKKLRGRLSPALPLCSVMETPLAQKFPFMAQETEL